MTSGEPVAVPLALLDDAAHAALCREGVVAMSTEVRAILMGLAIVALGYVLLFMWLAAAGS